MNAPSHLGQAYAQAVAAKRRQVRLGLLVLGLCVLFAGRIAEISPSKFFANVGSFTSYFYRIAHLESGQWVISDPVEWFWGWKNGWLSWARPCSWPMWAPCWVPVPHW